METNLDLDLGEPIEDQNVYGDEPNEPGISDEEGDGQAYDDEKEVRWKPSVFKAGKAQDGYFTNAEIMVQLELTMDILKKHYPNDHHIFIFDNATTYTKRPPTASAAAKMTKNPFRKFGVEEMVTVNRKIQYNTNGKPVKCTVQVGPGVLPNGQPHHFYDTLSSTDLGMFKGTTKILQECGLIKEAKLKGSCKEFKCPEGVTHCCQRHVLYNQLDFADQLSAVKIVCKARGYEAMFLPKFH